MTNVAFVITTPLSQTVNILSVDAAIDIIKALSDLPAALRLVELPDGIDEPTQDEISQGRSAARLMDYISQAIDLQDIAGEASGCQEHSSALGERPEAVC